MDKPVATYKSNELPIFVESGITVMLFLLLILVQSEGRLLLNRSVAAQTAIDRGQGLFIPDIAGK
jgi:hypothetical protein